MTNEATTEWDDNFHNICKTELLYILATDGETSRKWVNPELDEIAEVAFDKSEYGYYTDLMIRTSIELPKGRSMMIISAVPSPGFNVLKSEFSNIGQLMNQEAVGEWSQMHAQIQVMQSAGQVGFGDGQAYADTEFAQWVKDKVLVSTDVEYEWHSTPDVALDKNDGEWEWSS
jgi:hypothetical protein